MFTLQTTTFTKYSRISAKKCNQHEVLNQRCLQSITKYSRFTQRPSITKYSRVVVVDVCCCRKHPSRSTHECYLNIHHEITRPCPVVSCLSITKYSRVVVVVVVVIVAESSITKYSRIFFWRYSDVGYWWYQIVLLQRSRTTLDKSLPKCFSQRREEPKTQTASTEQLKPTDQSLCT